MISLFIISIVIVVILNKPGRLQRFSNLYNSHGIHQGVNKDGLGINDKDAHVADHNSDSNGQSQIIISSHEAQERSLTIKHFTFLKTITWLFKRKLRPRNVWPDNVPTIDDFIPYSYIDKLINEGDIHITYVGHTTFLIQTHNLNILTDPIWSDRASPLSFIGPKRIQKPGIKLENLPKIDLILVSHNHYDHLDIPTLKLLNRSHRPKIIVPSGNDKVLRKHLKDADILTLSWGEKVVLDSTSVSSVIEAQVSKFSEQYSEQILQYSSVSKASTSIHLETAQHWSARGLFDRNLALWGTFIIKTSSGNICFIGDSGYNPNIFKDIGRKYGRMLVSLIPIGAYEPREFMKYVHMNPEEAVLTHLDLNSKYSIGSHFDVFPLADEAYNQAIKELEIAKGKHQVEDFIIPTVGKIYKFSTEVLL